MTSPAGYGLSGGPSYAVQVDVNADGTVRGTLLDGLVKTKTTINLYTVDAPVFSTQSCTAPSFPWTLKPKS